MLLPIYTGQNYSYSYELETGHYLLYDNQYISHFYLQGDDARLFEETIAYHDQFTESEAERAKHIEEAIELFL